MWHLFSKFCLSFSKDSSDLLSTLSTSLELLRLLITQDGEDQDTEITCSLRAKAVTKSVESPGLQGPTCLKDTGQVLEVKEEPMETDMPQSKTSSEMSANQIKQEPGLLSIVVETVEEPKEIKEPGCKKKTDLNTDHSVESPDNELHDPQHQHSNHQSQPTTKACATDGDSLNNVGLPARKLIFSVPELAFAIGWHRADLPAPFETVENGETLNKKHPFFHLEKLLRECSLEEDSLESLHENVSGLIRILVDEGNILTEYKGLFLDFTVCSTFPPNLIFHVEIVVYCLTPYVFFSI